MTGRPPLEFLCHCGDCADEWVQYRPPIDARMQLCVSCGGPIERWWFRRMRWPRPRWSSSARYRERV